MKKIYTFFLIVLLSGYAQSICAQGLFEKWPTLKAYHDVLSATFHPSEQGNLTPIKTRSGEFAAQAKIVAAATIPPSFNSREMRRTVKKLKNESIRLDRMIRNRRTTDAQIKVALAALHDVFHEIIRISKEEHEDGKH